MPRLRDLTEEAPASQVVDALAPRAGEIVIRKTQASAFFGTHLGACLVANGTDTLIVTGCTTSYGARHRIDAMSGNYRTVVASDCVGDRALDPHRANLFDMRQKYSDVMRAAEIMAALEHSAA